MPSSPCPRDTASPAAMRRRLFTVPVCVPPQTGWEPAARGLSRREAGLRRSVLGPTPPALEFPVCLHA